MSDHLVGSSIVMFLVPTEYEERKYIAAYRIFPGITSFVKSCYSCSVIPSEILTGMSNEFAFSLEFNFLFIASSKYTVCTMAA